MTSLNATVWFREKLDCDRLAAGFERASQRLAMGLVVSTGTSKAPNSSEVWSKAISSFADFEYTGEAKWIFEGQHGILQGRITWPITNPGNIPGTIEFKVRWREEQKSKNFVFGEIDILIGVLHDFAFAVNATSLLVEPSRLPADIADERYERFRRLHSHQTLTSVDWICGVRTTDAQDQIFKRTHKPIASQSDSFDFDVFVFASEPFDYKLPEDRSRLKDLERECLLI